MEVDEETVESLENVDGVAEVVEGNCVEVVCSDCLDEELEIGIKRFVSFLLTILWHSLENDTSYTNQLFHSIIKDVEGFKSIDCIRRWIDGNYFCW